MRILILTQYFWPEPFRINEVANTLSDAGHEVIVLTGQPNYPDGKIYEGYSAWKIQSEFRGSLKIFRIPIIPRGHSNFVCLVLNYISFIFSATIFGSWALRQQSVDCILVYATSPPHQAIPAIWLGILKKAGVAVWIQDLWPESLTATGFIKNSFILSLVEITVEWIYRNCHLLLVQSPGFIEHIGKLSGKTPIIYHPNPGEMTFLTKDYGVPECILKPGFNVVFAGNLGYAQALPTILDAANQLRNEIDINIVIIGGGSRLPWLKDQIIRLNLENVLLLGRFRSDAMPAILDQASVLLVTLIDDPVMNLTVPSKIQTYLAARKPIIASMNGEGARVILDAGAGISCPAEDANALANAIREMRNNSSDELKKMGNLAGAYYVFNYEPRMLAVKLAETLSKLVRD